MLVKGATDNRIFLPKMQRDVFVKRAGDQNRAAPVDTIFMNFELHKWIQEN